LLQLTIDLGLNVDAEHGLHGTQTGEIDRDVPALGDCDSDRDTRAACGTLHRV